MVYNRYLENDSKLSIILSFMKKVFSLKNIIFSLLSFALANVTFMDKFTPFSYVMFGVASVFNVPMLLVLVFTGLGMIFQGISSELLIKLLVFFALFTFLTALLNIKGTSKKYSVLFKFLLSVVLVEVLYNFINDMLFTNLIGILSSFIIITILYFVFVSGMYVLINMRKGYVYTKEESVAMIALISITLTTFKDIQLLGFSIFNVLVLILMIIYGFRKGPIYGTAAGLVIGLMLTTIMDVNMTYIVSLAFSAMAAGIFGKFGKIPLVIAFVLGNIYIIYYANEFSTLTIRISEILIASVPLLFIPKNLEDKLSKLFDKNKTLNNTYENVLDTASNIKKKVGAVSDVFDSLSNTYVKLTDENLKENRDVIKNYLREYVNENCIDCKDKRLCMSDEKLDKISDNLADKLENDEYFDSSIITFRCEKPEKIVEEIKQIYSSMKLMRVLKEKEKENSKKISKQYKEVSKILSNIASSIKKADVALSKKQQKLIEELKFYGYNVYEDYFEEKDSNIEYTFVTDILTDIDKQKKEIISIVSNIFEQDMIIKLILNSSKKEKSKIKLVSIPAYELQSGMVSYVKSGEEISGDNYLVTELSDLKYMSILSDGAGSGRKAYESSKMVMTMMEKLLEGGFTHEKATQIINSVIKLNADEEAYSSLDSVAIDLKTAEANFVKIGSAPTYIISEGKVSSINAMNIPIGITEKVDYVPVAKMLRDLDIVVQISDGALNDTEDINNNYLTELFKSLDVSKSARNIAEDIGKAISKEKSNVYDDDITVLVTKVRKTANKQ